MRVSSRVQSGRTVTRLRETAGASSGGGGQLDAVGVKGYGIAVFVDVAGNYGEHSRWYECVPPEWAGVVEAEEVTVGQQETESLAKVSVVGVSGREDQMLEGREGGREELAWAASV
jgi:hypothetical protein